jgi:hypothetical protein
VQAELVPGGRLEELLQRAEAAGQHHEGVGEVVHQALAGVHVRHLVQLGQPGVRHLGDEQPVGDHPDHLAPAASAASATAPIRPTAAPP